MLFLFALLFLQLNLLPVLASELSERPRDKIIFAGDSAYPPFEWLNERIPQGFNIDLAREMSGAGGVSIEHKLGQWNEMIAALERGDVDVVPMFISDKRKKIFRFTKPFYVVNHAIYGNREQAAVSGIADLAGHSIAVEKLSYAHEQLLSEKFDVELILVSSTHQALQAAAVGIADFALLAEPTTEYLIKTRNLSIARLSPPFWPREYAFAVRDGEDELYQWLQEALDTAFLSHGYQNIYETWKSEIKAAGYSSINVPFYVGYTTIAAILLMVTFFVWAWKLRGGILKKAADLDRALSRAKTSETQANFLADYETETGLARPSYFIQLVERELATRPPNTELLIFKLVHLNEVRGTLGQSYSKELTGYVTEQLKAHITGLTCYYGRGIFAIFSNRAEISQFFTLLASNQSDNLPYSQYVAGSAHFPEHGMTSETLLSNADSALSVALLNHKDWVVYNTSMAPDPKDLEIISAFRTKSLEGLYAVFQPQIDIESGEIIGAEVLVRWKHPTLGVLNPADFIPLVEALGFVSQITEAMIDEAVRVAVLLRRRNRPLAISVNVSVNDLADPNFLSMIERALEHHEGQFSDLKLELTETSFSSESEHINDVLQRLNKLGVRISIDDFGTGYSSLAYLSMFPVQELKIDRSFVSDMIANSKNCNIIRSTLMLAEHLYLKTVAEGVEDLNTLNLLRDMGCDAAQGYFISKPLSEQDFLNFIANEN